MPAAASIATTEAQAEEQNWQEAVRAKAYEAAIHDLASFLAFRSHLLSTLW